MSPTRRQFLLRAAAAGGALWAVRREGAAAILRRQSAATLDPDRLRRYLAPLPLPPVTQARAGMLDLRMQAAACQLHPDLPPTRCWTYEGHFPGPTIAARAGEGLTIRWHNQLPAAHFLPVDHSLPGAGAALPPVRAVVHVHGARVPADSDGWPEDWSVPGQIQTFHYPNRQAGATLYYHDHAMGLGRLNIYAGLAGFYLLHDAAEAELRLPGGEADIPLLFCDRWLDPQGQLFYPTSGVPGHPWVPEVEANCMLVNGALWPRWRAEARPYRLRLCNGANTRSFRLGLSGGLKLHVIATDQGLLAAPVRVAEVALAPGERAEVLVDFRPAAGSTLELNHAGRPLMRIEVAAAASRASAWHPPARLARLDPLPAPVRRRRLTLNEYDDAHGDMALMLLDGKRWDEPVSEAPELGETEDWEFLNLTSDTHPIHLHQVRFRLLGRRPFDADEYRMQKTLRYTGRFQPAPADEDGWKDTVRCHAAEATRIRIRFESYAGRYVWHCHLLEHADNAMMRPYLIRSPKA